MSLQETVEIQCPYCGEPNTLLIDCSVGAQDIIEDCTVCCRPIYLHVAVDEDSMPRVDVRRDDD